jgi:hypothetical protein
MNHRCTRTRSYFLGSEVDPRAINVRAASPLNPSNFEAEIVLPNAMDNEQLFPLSITHNLAQALLHLRELLPPEYYVVWLGPQQDQSDLAPMFLDSIGKVLSDANVCKPVCHLPTLRPSVSSRASSRTGKNGIMELYNAVCHLLSESGIGGYGLTKRLKGPLPM